MPIETTYFVQPFGVDESGRLFHRPPLQAPSASAAVAMCARLEEVGGGAWAFEWHGVQSYNRRPFLRFLGGYGRIARECVPLVGTAG